MFFTFLFFCGVVHGSSVRADPDYVGTGFEFRGVPAVKIGDTALFGPLSLGGMVEVRNEKMFNQGALPNHNWRGFVFVYYGCQVTGSGSSSGVVTAGLEHESAHPAMGLNEPSGDPYQMIYDGTYRNINMNSFLLRYCHTLRDSYMLRFTWDFQLYVISRNTPELPNTDSGWSEGLSAGAEFSYPLAGGCDFFVSVFDRYIFSSRSESRGDVYYSGEEVPVQRNILYPVINSVNTVSFKTGITFHETGSGAEISLYCSVLYGNIYGFVDSRDKRMQYSAGIEFVH